MIVVRLKGGLGNQMFQYAYGYCQAHRLKTRLILDHTFLDNYPDDGTYTLRTYNLEYFELGQTSEVLRYPAGLKIRNKLLHDLHAKIYKVIHGLTYVKEDLEQPEKNTAHIQNNSYCSGFWQNPKYFKEREIGLQQTFAVKEGFLVDIDQDLLAQIEQPSSVSIHIRGGDYLKSENKAKFGGVGEQYYLKAIESIEKKVLNPKYYIFSNDINYAIKIAKQLDIDYHLVENTGKNATIHDMILMQNCNHNIITNSSFSWWAAYLNKNSNKEVLAPKNWFNDQKVRSQEIIPTGWQRI